jgi:hypothetical protein
LREATGAVDVCFTPEEIRPARVAVVIDVLRAISPIAQALAAGYPRVLIACLLNLRAVRRERGRGAATRARPGACIALCARESVLDVVPEVGSVEGRPSSAPGMPHR